MVGNTCLGNKNTEKQRYFKGEKKTCCINLLAQEIKYSVKYHIFIGHFIALTC